MHVSYISETNNLFHGNTRDALFLYSNTNSDGWDLKSADAEYRSDTIYLYIWKKADLQLYISLCEGDNDFSFKAI